MPDLEYAANEKGPAPQSPLGAECKNTTKPQQNAVNSNLQDPSTNDLQSSDEPQGSPRLSKSRSIILVSVLSSAGFLAVLNMQSVIIILPSISKDLSIPSNRQQLVVSIYNISSGCLMLLWGRLADVYGRRLVFLVGSSLFTLSTLCLPFSSYEIAFYVLRVLQGLSSAATMPSGIGMIAAAFPPGKARNTSFVALSAVASFGSVAGTLIGGFIGSNLSWKWVFWIPAVLSGLTTVACFFVTRTIKDKPDPTAAIEMIEHQENVHGNYEQGPQDAYVDWVGGAVISIGLTLLLVGLTQANVVGWSTPWIPPVIVLSVLLVGFFFFYQRRLERSPKRQPLVKVSMLKNKQFSALFVLVSFFYAAFNSFLVFASLFYQDYLGLRAMDATLRFLPAGISGLLISFAVSPALSSSIPGFWILLSGLICGFISPFLFALPIIPADTIYWAWGFPAMCLCMSVEIVWPVVGLLVAQSVPESDQALGGGLLQTVNHVSRSLGLAISTAVQAAVQGQKGDLVLEDESLLSGLRAAQWVNVGLAAGSICVAIGFFRNLK